LSTVLYAMPGYLPDSYPNLLQAVINKAFKLGYLSSVLDRQLFNKLNTNPSIVPSTPWKLHARFSLPQRKSKLFKDAYLNRVLFLYYFTFCFFLFVVMLCTILRMSTFMLIIRMFVLQ